MQKSTSAQGTRKYIIDIADGLPTILMQIDCDIADSNRSITNKYYYADGQILKRDECNYGAARVPGHWEEVWNEECFQTVCPYIQCSPKPDCCCDWCCGEPQWVEPIPAEVNIIPYYYVHDRLGSIRLVTDAFSTVVASYTYDSYGNKIASTGTSDNAYGFTGQQQFGEADSLVFLRARYYEPRVGRFISRDPLGVDPAGSQNNPFDPIKQYEDGMNLYEYVGNNPIMDRDPFGLRRRGVALTCEEKCEVRYRIATGACGSSFIASCLSGNPFGWVGWMICMEKARYKHMHCMADCVYI